MGLLIISLYFYLLSIEGVDIHFILALTTANVVMFFVLSLII